MSRLTVLCLACFTLAQALPEGCPPNEDGSEPVPIERDTLPTTAETDFAFVPVGATVTLTATVSPMPEGGVTYGWIQISGPGVRLLDSSAAAASFEAPSLETQATLQFGVTTYGADGSVGYALVSVNVAADPNYGDDVVSGGSDTLPDRPIPRAGRDQNVEPGETVTLDGSASRGNNLSYLWRQTDGPNVTLTDANTERATFTAPEYDSSGSNNSYEFELRITDAEFQQATDRIVITVVEASAEGSGDAVTDGQLPRVTVETTLGDFVIELDEENAPITVANFLEYVDDGFYDGTIFHRVIPGFVVQGGGFERGLVPKETNDPITSEADNGEDNDRATVAMARTNDPNSATSQFYVNLVDNDSLNYSGPGTGYTVFGKVIAGMDVVDLIAQVETTTRSGHNDVPVTDVVVEKISRVTATAES